MTFKKTILITGGAGFIGSDAVRYYVEKYPEYKIVNLDKLTYAGNLGNLRGIEQAENYHFIKADILDEETVAGVFTEHGVTDVIHFAAESHVDRSITNPLAFIQTNVLGTATLLNIAKKYWGKDEGHVFYHVSTDEVYGSLGETGLFEETTPYDPRSPYSASKSSSDHFVRAYYHTYGLPIKISNCSNNYGPFQFPEKLVPLMINNIIEQKDLPVYGDGSNIRDWLYVRDHVEAIDTIFHNGRIGETYNVGGHNELKNLDLVHKLCDITDEKLGRAVGTSRSKIVFVKDRPGHDQRYAIDSTKIQNELGWTPKETVSSGMAKTIEWYLSNTEWLNNVTSGEYQSYYNIQYG